jgi:tape measure domain-containing protein
MDVTLLIKAVDNATMPIKRITQSVGAMNEKIKATTLAMSAQNLGRSFSNFASTAAADMGRFAIAAGATGFALKKMFIDPAVQAERFSFQLKGLYKGDLAQTQKSFQFLKQFALESNFGIEELTQSFIRLEASGLNPADGALLALTDSAAKYGASREQFLNVTDAISQMAAIGKIELEQLKRVAVVIPDTFEALSAELGVTQEGMFKLLSQGKLQMPAVQALIRGLGKASQGAGKDFSKSFTGAISMIDDAWKNFAVDVMNSGAFDTLAQSIRDSLSFIDNMKANGSYGDAVKQFGAMMNDAAKAAIEIGKGVVKAGAVILPVFTYLIEAVGGFDKVIYALTAYMFANTIVAFAQTAQAIYGMAKASIVFAASNPLLAALTAISLVIIAIVANIDKIEAGFKRLFGVESNLPTFDMTSSIGIPMQSQTGIGPLANPAPIDYNRAIMRENKLFSESNINVTFDERGKPQVQSIKSSGASKVRANVGFAGAKL